MTRQKNIILIIISFLLITGCASTRLNVKFLAKDAKFPISLTEGFYDDDYNFVLKDNYVVIKHFKINYSLYSPNIHSKPKIVNLSDTLTILLNEYDCNAIVNFKITRVNPVRNRCCFQFVSSFTCAPTFSFFSPVSLEFIVEGDLVRITDKHTSYDIIKKDLFGL